MRRFFFLPFLCFFVFPIALGLHPSAALAATKTTTTAKSKVDYRGHFLIETEDANRVWYVSPTNGQRYYIKKGSEGMTTLGTLAVGITSKDLKKIPTTDQPAVATKLVNRLRGSLLLSVQDTGALWYVQPEDGRRVLLADEPTTETYLATEAPPVTDATLRAIPMNTKQIMFDPTFIGVADAKVADGQLIAGTQVNVIRPIASLSKLMAAMVMLDEHLDWNKEVTISQAVIDYPREEVGDAATSEVDLKVGDRVTVDDLWVSMLVASSNQSAVALAGATGLSRQAFIDRMNKKAKALGLKRTHFDDIAGLDEHNVSTAFEMAKIAEAAFAIPKIQQATEVLDRTFAVTTAAGTTRNVTVHDRNYSLRAFGVEAAKSGFLVEAGSNAAIEKDGSIMVVLHAHGLAQRNSVLQSLIRA